MSTPTLQDIRQRLPPVRLRGKITIPYVLLTLVVGGIAAYLVTQVMVAKLEERFANQLFEAANVVSEQMVEVEKTHLAIWRQVRFMHGLDQATAARDVKMIARLVAPAIINEHFGFVAVVDAQGNDLWSFMRPPHSTQVEDYRVAPKTDYANWPLVPEVLAGLEDERGDKWTALTKTPSGHILVTIGPIEHENQIVGALLVGTHLEELLEQLSVAALGRVTIYKPSGQILQTTLIFSEEDTLTITPEYHENVLADQEETHRRDITASNLLYSELFGPLEVRGGQDLAVMSVAVQRRFLTAVGPTRNMLLLMFTLAVAAILLVGWLLGRSISRPVETLASASIKVAQGDLSQQVPVETRDEIGALANSFNVMVAGLRERERIKDLFGMFATQEVAEELVKHGFALGGQYVEATAMFSDIRSFTTITESQPPEVTIDLLNDYFTYMISAISSEGGLVNQIVGDGLMAIFGAPLPRADHHESAVRAALKMIERIELFNRDQAEQGKVQIEIGIGIASGQVIAGYTGSALRATYTCVGDTVNLAARLEAHTKKVEQPIVIAESTRLGLPDTIKVEPQGAVKLKGKKKKVRVFSVPPGQKP